MGKWGTSGRGKAWLEYIVLKYFQLKLIYCYCCVLYVKDWGHTCMQNVMHAEIREQIYGASSLLLSLHSSWDQTYKSSSWHRAKALTHKTRHWPLLLYFLKKNIKSFCCCCCCNRTPHREKGIEGECFWKCNFHELAINQDGPKLSSNWIMISFGLGIIWKNQGRQAASPPCCKTSLGRQPQKSKRFGNVPNVAG